MLVLCQLDVGSDFIRVRWIVPNTKGCSDRWSGHAPSKLKSESSENESNFLNGYVCAYLFHAFR